MNYKIGLVLTIFLTFSNGYKVLVIAPFNGKSHFLYMQKFVIALIERHHEVSFLTSQSMKQTNLQNYTEYLIDPPLDLENRIPIDKIVNPSGDALSSITGFIFFPKLFNPYHLESAIVQKLIHSTDLHFDVIVMEDFFAESSLMFAHKFNAPIVTIFIFWRFNHLPNGPFGATDFIDRQHGFIPPLSIVPHWMLTYSDKMSFSERWYNSVVTVYDYFVRKFIYLPSEEGFAKKYFSHLAPLPSMDELHRKVSVVLVNSHRALSPPRPSMPSVINIGGAQLTPAKPLPKDLQIFLDRSTNGVIYFSLGTVVKSSKLPKDFIQTVLDSFQNVKQNVLWKYEDESLTNVPSNVMIKSWMPQNDILAHPNIVLFISHGGSFSMSEALYHGVPLLIIPFFGDQHRNAYRIQAAGCGKFLDYLEITTDSLTATIKEITSDESFMAKAKETSAIFRDNLVHPMDEAMFWIEHVAKFKGAKHLQSYAIHMSWFSYLLLDVLIVNIIAILAIISTIYWIVKKLFCKKKCVQETGKKQN